VNPSNRISQLSVDQVKKIFTGAIDNWSGVGGPPGPIEIVLPNDNTDELHAFHQLVLGDANVAASTRRVGSLPDVSATVGHDRGAIGMVGFDASDPARVVRLASRDGSPIVASSLNIGQKRYPLTTTLYLYSAAASRDPLATQFVSFAQSEAGQTLVTSSGSVGRNSF
jgi:phosphate transport system substrate-binding protein